MYCILIAILLMLPQVSPLLSAHFHRVERETRFICETPVKSSLSMRRRARLVRCVRARMQICNFVAKHKRGPACRSPAWDVVRQKAVKRRGPRSFRTLLPRVRSRVKANAHAYTHELSRPFTAVYLRRAGTRSLRPRWSFPGIALSGTRRR